MLDTTEKFINKYRDVLDETELITTHAHMDSLRQAVEARDKDAIQFATEALNDVSRPYAERVMDGALKDAMKGRKIV